MRYVNIPDIGTYLDPPMQSPKQKTIPSPKRNYIGGSRGRTLWVSFRVLGFEGAGAGNSDVACGAVF